MARRRLASVAAPITLMLVTVIVACRDVTAPSTRSARHPLIGVYDVTTELDSFSFEAGGSLPCGSLFAPSCALVRPSNGGLLRGTLTIGDSLVLVDTILPIFGDKPIPRIDTVLDRLPIVRGDFVGRSCAVIDFTNHTGCLAFGDTVRVAYPVVSTPILTVARPGSQRAFTTQILSSGLDQKTLTFTTTADAGDTIWGRVRWQTEPGRHPPTFTGSFRAVQRR